MLTKIVPYASFPYADHALREVGVADPNAKAEATDEHIDELIAAANFLREMVRDMASLEDIRGFITYAEEEAKESGTKQIRTDGVKEEKKASGSEVEQL